MAPVNYKEKIEKLNKGITKASVEAKTLMDEFEGKPMPEGKADEVDKLCVEAEDMQIEVKRLTRLLGIEPQKVEPKPNLTLPHEGEEGEKNPAAGSEPDIKDDPVIGYMTMGKAFTIAKVYLEGKAVGFQGSSPMAAMEVNQNGLVPVTKSTWAEIKADDVTTSIAGDLIQNDRVGEVVRDEDRPLRIRSLLSVGRTGSDTIEYLEETFDNQAAGVPEIFEGEATKPKSDIRYEEKTGLVKQIAHYVRISNKMLADAPQLQSVIDTRLAYGLDLVEENQLLWGTGASNDLTGILNTVGIQDYAAIHTERGETDPADTLLDKIRRSRTNVALQFYEASGVAIHPIDFEAIELLKGSDNRYLWVTVPDGAGMRVWRLPVVESVALENPVGNGERHCIVGAFRIGANIFDREGTNIEVGYANDDFITNYKRIRAEKRLALVVWRPAAFIDIETQASLS
jgi:HK97 family phage major capsid protein